MFRYPLRSGNSFELLIGGDAFLAKLLELLDASTSEVLFEMYLVDHGKALDLVFEAMFRAASRGVKIFLLLDGYGARRVLTKVQRDCSDVGNIYFCIYNPISFRRLKASIRRDHRKIVVIDGQFALISGFGIVDDFYATVIGYPAERSVWQDVAVVSRGPVVSDWRHFFYNTWPGQLSLPDLTEAGPVGEMCGRLAYGARWNKQDIMRELRVRISKARTSVWIVSPYFLTSWRIRRLLRQASLRGLDVRVLVPGSNSDHPPVSYASKRHYQRLLRAGVRLFEFQAGFMHAKVYLCDDWVSIGSFNLDHWTYRFNLEANQEIVNQVFSVEVASQYEKWLLQSNEVTSSNIEGRGLVERFLVFILGKLDAWLMRIFK